MGRTKCEIPDDYSVQQAVFPRFSIFKGERGENCTRSLFVNKIVTPHLLSWCRCARESERATLLTRMCLKGRNVIRGNLHSNSNYSALRVKMIAPRSNVCSCGVHYVTHIMTNSHERATFVAVHAISRADKGSNCFVNSGDSFFFLSFLSPFIVPHLSFPYHTHIYTHSQFSSPLRSMDLYNNKSFGVLSLLVPVKIFTNYCQLNKNNEINFLRQSFFLAI